MTAGSARRARLRVNREWESLEGPRWRELEIEGDSEGPGGHLGSRQFVATAHIRQTSGPAPFVLLLHGYAVPQTTYDRWLARQLRLRGAHTARLDLPFHLRRTLPGQRSGDGYFSLDPAHIRAVVRQSVEDAAAIIAWARAEVSPQVTRRRSQPRRFDRDPARRPAGAGSGHRGRSVLRPGHDALAAPADPLAAPSRHDRRGHAGPGPPTAPSAGRFLQATLAPLVARNLTPRTPGERITLVRAMQDLVVGPDPVTELAAAWQTDLWTYPHGHMTVMSASGIARRIADRATAPPPAPDLSVAV